MKYICNLSGGLCSFWAAYRIIEKYGRENVIWLFADTLIESPDLYKFNTQCSQLLGVPIVRVSREMTPWELFRQEGMIANDRFPICSTKLKRKPLNDWMDSNYHLSVGYGDLFMDREEATVVLGFDWTEEHRVEKFREVHPDWRLIAPMTEEPIWDKCRMKKEAEALGLILPASYDLGFPHANCRNRCVRAGISHFVHLLEVDPPSFQDWEDEEYWTMAYNVLMGRSSSEFTILKDRRGGESKPMTLRSLRLRVESGEKFDRFDWGGCGCGGVA